MAKKAVVKEEQETKAPETEVKEQENLSTAPVEEQETKAPTTKAGKVYNFTSSNPFLTVTSLGVQFVAGKASTKDLSVARALVTIDGVELVEE